MTIDVHFLLFFRIMLCEIPGTLVASAWSIIFENKVKNNLKPIAGGRMGGQCKILSNRQHYSKYSRNHYDNRF